MTEGRKRFHWFSIQVLYGHHTAIFHLYSIEIQNIRGNFVVLGGGDCEGNHKIFFSPKHDLFILKALEFHSDQTLAQVQTLFVKIPAYRQRGHSITACNAATPDKSKMAARGPHNG